MGHAINLLHRRHQRREPATAIVLQALAGLLVHLTQVLRSVPVESVPVRSIGSIDPKTRVPNDETPGAATPGVSGMPTSLARNSAMQTLPQPRDAAVKPNKPLAEVGTAQHTALMRWFARVPVQTVCNALQANPRYPLVPCNAQARPFAPDRGTPRSVA